MFPFLIKFGKYLKNPVLHSGAGVADFENTVCRRAPRDGEVGEMTAGRNDSSVVGVGQLDVDCDAVGVNVDTGVGTGGWGWYRGN